MSDTALANITTSGLADAVKNYSPPNQTTDGTDTSIGAIWDNRYFKKYYGHYKAHPELKAAIHALGNWTTGNSYQTDKGTKAILNRITGSGEDTFESLMWNGIIIKKINGDAYFEIIRNEDGDLINIKALNPETMRTVYTKNGIIKEYQQWTGSEYRTLKRTRVLHLMNDRVADEIHGTSVVEACEWVINARREAMEDWKRLSHRSTIRVMYIDADNTAKLNSVKSEYAEAIKNGELLIIPAKKGEAEFQDLVLPPIEAFMRWIEYLENFFYTAVGVPKVVLGGSSEFTEASSKIALVTYDQAWKKEQADLEADLWNQVGILIKWNSPASLMSEAITDEQKNTGQLGFQQNDVEAAGGKTAL